MSAEEEEARRIAEMGKPILGEHSRLEVVIEESYEFKVRILFFFLCQNSVNLFLHWLLIELLLTECVDDLLHL